MIVKSNYVLIYLLFLIFYCISCTEHFDIELDENRDRMDFSETVRLSDKPTEVHIIFQPQINSDRYYFGVRFPHFEFDPSNHALADTSQWYHLIDNLEIAVYDEYGEVIGARTYNTNANRLKGFSSNHLRKDTGTGISFRDEFIFRNDRSYRFVITFPAIYDPNEQFPTTSVVVRLIDTKFKFELYF